ncbi:MAG: hypothetical protein U9R38_02705 [Candidatus Margulisiibacteriota bacterium]|nr:hypothetical protein [Candidatus Margulisiibacteriota bacterium]
MERDLRLRAYRDSGLQDKALRREVVDAAVDPRHYYSLPLIAALRDIHILTTPWQPITFESISQRFIAANSLSVVEAVIGHVFESGWGRQAGDQRLQHLSMRACHPHIEMGQTQELLSAFGINPHYYIPARHPWNLNPEWFFGTYHNVIEGLIKDIALKVCERFTSDPMDRARLLSLSLIIESALRLELRKIIPHDYLSDQEIADARRLTDMLTEEHSPWIRSAYHFTRKELFPSILEHGLNVDYFPEGVEQPDIVCFNNFQRAGASDIALGFNGYYVRDILLRVPLESVGPGHKSISQELGDYNADYQATQVPVDRISVVDPYNSTRVIPLAEFV